MTKPRSWQTPSENDQFLNRELSLLEFQRRVLEETRDPAIPLLERIKCLAIVGSNLDEFFKVRIGGILMQNKTGVVELSIDGRTPAEQLDLLFPGMTVLEAYPFRVTRNADFEIQELEAGDLLESMKENVQERQFG